MPECSDFTSIQSAGTQPPTLREPATPIGQGSRAGQGRAGQGRAGRVGLGLWATNFCRVGGYDEGVF